MIELKNITKYYETAHSTVTALKNIDLKVEAGEIFGVIGKSGAGKSSLIRCVNLLERPSEGLVYVDNQSLTELSEKELRHARRYIGMIFQHFNLLLSKTVYDNVALPLTLQGLSKKAIELEITPLLELTGLTDKKLNYPSQLSGGQKQRVAIARALASNPKVLLCDEATSALDPDTTRSILKLLKNINKQFGLTILLITHEMDVIKAICDHVALLEKGEIIKQSTVLDFFARPHPEPGMEFLKAYLRHELPEPLQEVLLPEPVANSYPVIRIFFHGKVTSKPIIAKLIQAHHLEVNILQANIEHVQNEMMGTMVVSLGEDGHSISPEKLQEICQHLEDEDLTVEVIGYVTRNVVSTT